MSKYDHILTELRTRFPKVDLETADQTILLSSPNADLRTILIECLPDQIIVSLGSLYHTHFYGCEPDADSTTESAGFSQAEDTINFIADFIHERFLLWVSASAGSSGISPADALIEYDTEEEYWPNGKPNDRRMLWSRTLQKHESK